jgi:hypothetical protein
MATDLTSRRRHSPSAWERSHRAAVEQAFATVPHYREMWAEAGIRLPEPKPTCGADLDSLLAGLYPFTEPYEPRREAPPWLGEPAELFEALQSTGGYRGERPLFEVRDALLDWDRIGPRAGRHRYEVVLSADAEVADPALREASVRAFVAAREPALLGSSAQIADLSVAVHDAVSKAQIFVRTSLTDLGRTGDEATVLHDARLGYLGARHQECGQAHLNWRRLYVRQSPNGPLFTMLRRRRPTLVNVVVPGTAHLSAGQCPVHGSPILTAEGAAW